MEDKVDLWVRTARSRVRSSACGTSSTPPTSCSAASPRHAATLLRGKHKPTFAPHVDTGDFVIVVNAGKVALTGNKRQTKVAYRHSGYPGGLKPVGYEELLTKHPERAIELAVKGMLPHNRLGRQLSGS